VADRCPFIDHLPSCAPVNSPSGCSAVEEYFVQVLSIVAMPVSLRVQAGHYTAMAQPSVIPPVEQTLSDATQQRVFASGSGGGGHTPTLEKSRHCVSRTVGSWLSEGLGLATPKSLDRPIFRTASSPFWTPRTINFRRRPLYPW
jgi:hypothetical protein